MVLDPNTQQDNPAPEEAATDPVIVSKDAQSSASAKASKTLEERTKAGIPDASGKTEAERLRAADIAARREFQATEPVTFDAWAQGIMDKDGVGFLGKTPVDAALLKQAQTDIRLKADLIGKYESNMPTAPNADVVTAFTTASGTFDEPAFKQAVGEDRYIELLPKAQRVQKAQQELLKTFDSMGMAPEVADLLANDILQYRGVAKETFARFKEAGRGLGMALPDFVFLTLPSAVSASIKTGDLPGGAEFMSEYDIKKQDWENFYSGWKNTLTENLPALDAADSFNASIHTALAKKYEGDEYENLAFERTSAGEFALDEDGQRIKKQFVKPENVQVMIDSTYNTLSKWEKFGVDVSEEGIWAAATGPIGMARGAKRVSNVMSYKNSPKFGPMLKDVNDPEEILDIVNRNGAKEKADSYFKLGVVQYRVDSEIKYANDRVREIDIELKSPKTTDDMRRELSAEKTQLVNTVRGARFTGKTIPYVKDVGESAIIIGAGTALGRELNLFSDDPETSAAISNMLMSFGGYRLGYGAKGLGKKVLSAGGGAIKYGVPTIWEMGKEIAGNIPLAGPIFVEGTLKNIENAMGTVFNAQQQENIRNIIKLHQNLNPNTRAQSLRHMDETADLHARVLNRVRPENRDRFNELLLKSYGNTFGIVSLAAAGELNRGKIDLDTLSKFDLQDMEADFTDMEKSFLVAGESLAEMKNMVLDIDDIASQKIVKDYIGKVESGLTRLQERVRKTNQDRLNNLDNLEKYVIKFGPRENLDEDMLNALEAHRRAVSKLAGVVYNPIDFLQKANKQLGESVDDSLKRARLLRDKPGHVDALNEATSALVLSKKNRFKMVGEQIYKLPRELAQKSGPISLKPLVDDIIASQGVDGVKRFFSESSLLYTGSEGSSVRRAMESMVETSISKKNMNELRNKLIDAAETGAEKNRFREMGNLDIAVEMMSAKGPDGQLLNPDFNPFMAADPYDLELVRRAFSRAKSTFYSSSEFEKAAEYGKFIDRLDSVVESQASTEYFTAITDARKSYEMEVGLPQSPKLLLDKYEKTKVRRVNELGFGMKFKNVYSENPVAIFDDFAEATIGALMPTKTGKMFGPSKNKLPLIVDNMVANFGTFSEKNGEFVFDLTTEKGKEGFQELQDILKEVVYSRTGATFLEKYRAVKRPGQPAGLAGSINPELANYADDVTQDLGVSFILEEGGDVVKLPILDVTEAVSVKEDLITSIQKSPVVKNAFEKLKIEFSDFEKGAKATISELNERDKRTYDLFEKATRSMSSKEFADKFIFTPEGGELAVLKERVTGVLIASGMKPQDADDSFQTVATYYTMSGLFEKAGRGGVSGRVMSRAAGEKLTETFFSPQEALAELQKPGVRKNLEEILDPEHIDFLEDTMQLLNDSKTAVNVRGATGDYIGIGLAGKVSRIYNAVKGVVNPAYIASEYAITAAKAGKISMMKLALQDKTAARLIHKFLKTPNLIGGNDLAKFDNILKNFLFTELAQEGQKIALDGEGDLIPGVYEVGEAAVETVVDTADSAANYIMSPVTGTDRNDDEETTDETNTEGQ